MTNGIFENMLHTVVSKLLDEMATVQKVKALPMVSDWSWLEVARIGKRAKDGKPLSEPEGSNRHLLGMGDLMFLPAQLARLPLMESDPVDTTVVIGPQAQKPLQVANPVLITAMGYGVSVSKQAKIAMAKASRLAQTVVNSGEGGFVPEERENTDRYILQYNKARYAIKDEDLTKVDAIEIRVGQGAESSAGYTIQPDMIGEKFRNHLGLKENEPAVMPAKFPEWTGPEDLKKLVDDLRNKSGGVPIGVKICAGEVEQDLEVAVQAGVDFITLDGGQGGTAYSPEVTINSVGIPTIYALPRAQRFLTAKGVRDNITLISSGGYKNAGEILKGLALGADACYIGQAVLVALSYHQWDKMSVGSTPLDMTLYDGKHTIDLDIEYAAETLANFIKASTAELQLLARCMGKKRLKEVVAQDLAALSPLAAEVTGVKLAYGLSAN